MSRLVKCILCGKKFTVSENDTRPLLDHIRKEHPSITLSDSNLDVLDEQEKENVLRDLGRKSMAVAKETSEIDYDHEKFTSAHSYNSKDRIKSNDKFSKDEKRTSIDKKRTSKDEKRASVGEKRASVDVKRPSKDEKRPSKDEKRPSKDEKRPSKDERRPSQDEKRASKDEKLASKEQKRPSKDEKRLSKDEKQQSKVEKRLSNDDKRMSLIAPFPEKRSSISSRSSNTGSKRTSFILRGSEASNRRPSFSETIPKALIDKAKEDTRRGSFFQKDPYAAESKLAGKRDSSEVYVGVSYKRPSKDIKENRISNGAQVAYQRKYNYRKPTSSHRVGRVSYKSSVEKWKYGKSAIICPKCGANKRPLIKVQTDKVSNSPLGAACILTCWPFCFLPCIFPSPAREFLHCADCNHFLGVYDRKTEAIQPNENNLQTPPPTSPIPPASPAVKEDRADFETLKKQKKPQESKKDSNKKRPSSAERITTESPPPP